MNAKPMTIKEWRAFLNKAAEEFDWDAARQNQEPVAWITHESKWRLTGGGNAGGTVPVHAKQSKTAKYPLYTAPQTQREWVGLTDEEWETTHWSPDFSAGARWADAKLREKNT